ncbi:MAG: alpha/beta fold hydrolase [Actinomycetota bacterium]
MQTVRANGIEFSYLESGEGPLVLLLHGFPDNAHTWSKQMDSLAAAGFRAVAPFTRGYAPTQAPEGSFFDTATLATDARALIEALAGEPSFVVGHDWGAATTYMLTAAFPEWVSKAVTLALPHPAFIARGFLDPASVHRTFHFWFFQLAELPEIAIRANDLAFIDYLWNLWSPGLDDSAHVSSVKKTLSEPGALEAALGYYRSMFDPARQDPALNDMRAAFADPIKAPMMTMMGSNDDLMRTDAAAAQGELFNAEFRFEKVAEAGHFLHREQPDAVSKLIIDWLR